MEKTIQGGPPSPGNGDRKWEATEELNWPKEAEPEVREQGEALGEDEGLTAGTKRLRIADDDPLMCVGRSWEPCLEEGESEGAGEDDEDYPITPPPSPAWSSDGSITDIMLEVGRVRNERERELKRALAEQGGEEEEVVKEEEDAWDPMSHDYYSKQNVAGGDPEQDPKSFIMGERYKPVKDADILCPFYKNSNKPYCFKGPRCQYKHILNPVEEDPKVVYPTRKDLMKRTLLLPNFMLEAQVVYIKSPSDFFIVPARGAECLCECLTVKDPDEEPAVRMRDFCNYKISNRTLRALSFIEFGKGIPALKCMAGKLKDTLETQNYYRRVQIATYTAKQLVAVRLTRGEGDPLEWYRGEVLEDNSTAKEPSPKNARKLLWYRVQLIDIGLKLKVRVDNMCPLPVAFTSYPPMAIRCSLGGIVPVSLDWHPDVTTKLKRWVRGEILTMEVLKNRTKNRYPVDLLFYGNRLPEPTTYKLSIAQHMADLGMGLLVNQQSKNCLLTESNDQAENNILMFYALTADLSKPPPAYITNCLLYLNLKKELRAFALEAEKRDALKKQQKQAPITGQEAEKRPALKKQAAASTTGGQEASVICPSTSESSGYCTG